MLQGAAKYLRILVVDDSPAFVRTLCAFFENDPNVEIVGTASSGHQALVTVGELQPDLVLMDLQMPGMSGLEATKVLSRRFPAIPVVMLTAHDMPGLRQACKDSGAYEFAAKDRLSVELPAILAQLLPSRES
ncbi:MAG: response regulator transcription factor [Acidobacteriia bacterium]|nr:response regulator transcription factor [Terriglobia bacterium]